MKRTTLNQLIGKKEKGSHKKTITTILIQQEKVKTNLVSRFLPTLKTKARKTKKKKTKTKSLQSE